MSANDTGELGGRRADIRYAYSDPAWDDVLAENKRLRAALKMVASKIMSGDDIPGETFADFTPEETEQIFGAIHTPGADQ